MTNELIDLGPLWELIAMLREGRFYEDYDLSMAKLDMAEQSLQQVHDRQGGHPVTDPIWQAGERSQDLLAVTVCTRTGQPCAFRGCSGMPTGGGDRLCGPGIPIDEQVTVRRGDLVAILNWLDDAADYLAQLGLLEAREPGPCFMRLREASATPVTPSPPSP